MSLGEKIRKFRKDRDWTQDELGRQVGVHGRHVTRWEKNKMKPSAKTLARLAEVFAVSVDELTRENGATRLDPALPDAELFSQFQAIAQFPDDDKNAIKHILQALIREQQVKHLMGR